MDRWKTFELAGGSTVGRLHRTTGRNNQDAWGWLGTERGLVAVVCDGCGSAPSSEVGAQLGCRLVLNEVQHLLAAGHAPPSSEFWGALHARVVARLTTQAALLSDPPETAVASYLLFTIVGAVVTSDTTSVFSLGDGLFALNGEVVELGPFEDNKPPYLGYALLSSSHGPTQAFEVHRALPTAEVSSLLLGTDGVVDLTSQLEGGLASFWTEDSYWRSRDAVRRRLAMLNRPRTRPDWERRSLEVEQGALPDDTTVIVLRRAEG